MAKLPIHPDLIAEMEAYRDRHGLTDTGLGDLFMRDPNLLRDLRNGRELRRSTESDVQGKLLLVPEQIRPRDLSSTSEGAA